jgi:hypothetical protein
MDSLFALTPRVTLQAICGSCASELLWSRRDRRQTANISVKPCRSKRLREDVTHIKLEERGQAFNAGLQAADNPTDWIRLATNFQLQKTKLCSTRASASLPWDGTRPGDKDRSACMVSGLFYDAFSPDTWCWGTLPEWMAPYFDPRVPVHTNQSDPNQFISAVANGGNDPARSALYGGPDCFAFECDVFSFRSQTSGTPYMENYNNQHFPAAAL